MKGSLCRRAARSEPRNTRGNSTVEGVKFTVSEFGTLELPTRGVPARAGRFEVLGVDFVENFVFGNVVEINGGGDDGREVHAHVFEIIELIAHGLAQLRCGGRGIRIQS